MIINSPDGKAMNVFSDGKINVVGSVENYLHEMAEIGKAWVYTTKQSVTTITDNVILHFFNNSDIILDIHSIIVSSSVIGTVTVESGRTYTSGGTALGLRQLNTGSGNTLSLTVYGGTALTLAGTAVDLIYSRIPINTPINILDRAYLMVSANTGVAIRLQSDTQPATITVTILCHGLEPWNR